MVTTELFGSSPLGQVLVRLLRVFGLLTGVLDGEEEDVAAGDKSRLRQLGLDGDTGELDDVVAPSVMRITCP